MDLSPLVTELKKPEYADKTDQECVDILNLKSVVVRRPVQASLLKQRAIEEGVWGNLQFAITDDTLPSEKRKLAMEAVSRLNDTRNELGMIDLDASPTIVLIAALQVAGFLTNENVTNLSAKADKIISWAESVKLDVIGLGYVINARRLIAEGYNG